MQYKCNEKDWKLFKKYIPIWQEKYILKTNQEYIEILSRENNASTNFWDLFNRINKDRYHIGICVDMSRSKLFFNIMSLITEGVISFSNLDEFSKELKEEINFIIERSK